MSLWFLKLRLQLQLIVKQKDNHSVPQTSEESASNQDFENLQKRSSKL